MLPKINRLKKTKDIERVFREGRGFGEGFLFLKLAKNDLNAVRFAFIVGKKISNRASVRNKIKRIMRDAVQKRIDNIKYGFDAVIIAPAVLRGFIQVFLASLLPSNLGPRAFIVRGPVNIKS